MISPATLFGFNNGNSHRIFLVAGLFWACVYGLLNFLSNTFILPAAPFISLRPQIAIPMTVGIIFGPSAGFLAGGLGNILGDALSGYGMMTFWNWHIANGLLGLLPGILPYVGVKNIRTVRDFAALQFAVVCASAFAVGIAVLLDIWCIHVMKFPESFNSWILPAFITDAVNGFVLVPLLLFALHRVVVTLEIHTILMISFLLVAAILSTSIAITWSVWDMLISKDAMIDTFYFAGILSTVLLSTGFAVAVFFVRRITLPIKRLTRAAQAAEKGSYETEALDSLSQRSDELGHLSKVFQHMIEEVHGREKQLRHQVEELQIRIDRTQQARDVAEIVDSDYFQHLRKKVQEFRKP